MFKTIGIGVFIVGVVCGAAAWFGVIDFGVDANLTPKGKSEIQSARNNLADVVRGK